VPVSDVTDGFRLAYDRTGAGRAPYSCTFDDAALRLLPSAGHFSPLEAPDEFAAEILAAAGLTGHGRE
jgi:pimeloyl-ACP methyl ester carboxylesterase